MSWRGGAGSSGGKYDNVRGRQASLLHVEPAQPRVTDFVCVPLARPPAVSANISSNPGQPTNRAHPDTTPHHMPPSPSKRLNMSTTSTRPPMRDPSDPRGSFQRIASSGFGQDLATQIAHNAREKRASEQKHTCSIRLHPYFVLTRSHFGCSYRQRLQTSSPRRPPPPDRVHLLILGPFHPPRRPPPLSRPNDARPRLRSPNRLPLRLFRPPLPLRPARRRPLPRRAQRGPRAAAAV